MRRALVIMILGAVAICLGSCGGKGKGGKNCRRCRDCGCKKRQGRYYEGCEKNKGCESSYFIRQQKTSKW
mgnify:CR=1 FL=1|jgi:hypothetical protein